ncbi:DUF732 domain-containing protein [Modestobacter lapidis]
MAATAEEAAPVAPTPRATTPSSTGTGAGSSSADSFLRQARGTGGNGWVFQSDSNLLALGRQACGLLEQGLDPQVLVDAMLDSGSGAGQQEVVDLVNAANSSLC